MKLLQFSDLLDALPFWADDTQLAREQTKRMTEFVASYIDNAITRYGSDSITAAINGSLMGRSAVAGLPVASAYRGGILLEFTELSAEHPNLRPRSVAEHFFVSSYLAALKEANDLFDAG